jgi:hypothetical protein
LIEADGFSVRLFNPEGARYREGGRDITLLTETVDETDQRGRRFFLLPSVAKVVYVPSSLSWDDGTPLSADHYAVVLERVRGALGRAEKHNRIAVDDGMYENVQRVVDKAGSGAEG